MEKSHLTLIEGGGEGSGIPEPQPGFPPLSLLAPAECRNQVLLTLDLMEVLDLDHPIYLDAFGCSIFRSEPFHIAVCFEDDPDHVRLQLNPFLLKKLYQYYQRDEHEIFTSIQAYIAYHQARLVIPATSGNLTNIDEIEPPSPIPSFIPLMYDLTQELHEALWYFYKEKDPHSLAEKMTDWKSIRARKLDAHFQYYEALARSIALQVGYDQLSLYIENKNGERVNPSAGPFSRRSLFTRLFAPITGPSQRQKNNKLKNHPQPF